MSSTSRIDPEWAVALRALLKERSKGEVNTWGFVAAFMDMIDEVVASASEKQATELLREARPYLDLIAPSVSKERPLVMVTTKCDAEALAKRIDDFFGEKA